MLPIRPIDNPELYALLLRFSADKFIIHHTVFDNPQEATWLGKKMVEQGNADAYEVFPVSVSRDSYARMTDYMRFGLGV